MRVWGLGGLVLFCFGLVGVGCWVLDCGADGFFLGGGSYMSLPLVQQGQSSHPSPSPLSLPLPLRNTPFVVTKGRKEGRKRLTGFIGALIVCCMQLIRGSGMHSATSSLWRYITRMRRRTKNNE